MKVKVKVHAGSSQEKINKISEGYEVWLKVRAVDGKANLALIKLLKGYLKKDIKIKSGHTSKNKIIEVLN